MALGIQGSAPPTASSRRGTSSAKRETEASVLEELSGKLNSKMRQKFSAVAGDLKAQEIIGKEVSEGGFKSNATRPLPATHSSC